MHIQKSVSYLLESLQHALLQSHWSPTVAYSKAEVCSVWGKHGSAKLNRGTVLFVEHLKKPSLDQLYEKFYIRWDLKWFINVVYSEAKSSFLRVGFEPTTSELCAGALPTELSSPIVAVLGYFFNNYVGNRQHKARKQLARLSWGCWFESHTSTFFFVQPLHLFKIYPVSFPCGIKGLATFWRTQNTMSTVFISHTVWK